jgi:magnesium transporter
MMKYSWKRIPEHYFMGMDGKEADMCYFSEILGKPVEDAHGNHLGVLSDLVARVCGETQKPALCAIVVEQQGKTILVPYIKGTLTSSPTIPIRLPNTMEESYIQEPTDIFLARDVLDKILTGSDNTRKAQVSDLKFENLDGQQTVKAIDVGNLGILRRCGLVKTAQAIASHQGFSITEHLIPWDAVQFDLNSRSLKLTGSMELVSDHYNTKLAKILPGLNRYQRKQFIENLDDNRLAEIFIQSEPDVQSSAALNLSDERLAKVIMEMGPDEAVSLLARLSRNCQESVLSKVEPDISRVLQKLLYYPHNTVGRIMATSYLHARPDQTAAQALASIRQTKDGVEAGDSVYICDANDRLAGMTSLNDLAMANSNTPVASMMSKKVISVHLLDRVEDVTSLIFKYNLQAVPVVDENNILRGVVLAKDALDKRVPATWKKRQPKKYVHPVLS